MAQVPRPRASRLPDLVCLSHLRWNFGFQRPQHLMTRCARDRRVYFVEEPIFDAALTRPRLQTEKRGDVTVVVPHLPDGLTDAQRDAAQRKLLDSLLVSEQVSDYILWYYSPMALGFSQDLSPRAVIYDCMDELS